jgi:hypothetical protein
VCRQGFALWRGVTGGFQPYLVVVTVITTAQLAEQSACRSFSETHRLEYQFHFTVSVLANHALFHVISAPHSCQAPSSSIAVLSARRRILPADVLCNCGPGPQASALGLCGTVGAQVPENNPNRSRSSKLSVQRLQTSDFRDWQGLETAASRGKPTIRSKASANGFHGPLRRSVVAFQKLSHIEQSKYCSATVQLPGRQTLPAGFDRDLPPPYLVKMMNPVFHRLSPGMASQTLCTEEVNRIGSRSRNAQAVGVGDLPSAPRRISSHLHGLEKRSSNPAAPCRLGHGPSTFRTGVLHVHTPTPVIQPRSGDQPRVVLLRAGG